MKTMTKLFAGLVFSMMAISASASVVTLDIFNHFSYDESGGQKNIYLTFDLNALTGMETWNTVEIDGIGWDLNIETVGESWLSEASISFEDGELILTPGTGDDFSGIADYSSNGVILLADIGLPNLILEDGLLTIELFELFDDGPLELDAIINGTLTISTVMEQVPVPAAMWLMISGLASFGFMGRRRKTAV